MNTALSEKIKSQSLGLIKNTVDLCLFSLAFGLALSMKGKSTRAVHESMRFAEGITYDSLRRSFKHMRAKGWIKKDMTLTKDGQKRLNAILPQIRQYPKKWNSTWYVISFDIPELQKYKRNILRGILRKIGFGKLHESFWVSPYNFLGDIKDQVAHYKLTPFVIPATSKELGTRHSKELARTVWPLDEINNQYRECISENDRENAQELLMKYMGVLHKDPFLPRPLLPEPWYGDRAHTIYAKKLTASVVSGQ